MYRQQAKATSEKVDLESFLLTFLKPSSRRLLLFHFSESHLGTNQSSMMERSRRNSQRFLAVTTFANHSFIDVRLDPEAATQRYS